MNKKGETYIVLLIGISILIIFSLFIFEQRKLQPTIIGYATAGYGELPDIGGGGGQGAPLGDDIPPGGGCVPLWEKVSEPCSLKKVPETIWVETELYRHVGWNLPTCSPEQLPDKIIEEVPCQPNVTINVRTNKQNYLLEETVYLDDLDREIEIIERNCVENYTTDWYRAEDCSPVNCSDDIFIDCETRREGFFWWIRINVREICQKETFSGECAMDNLRFCRNGNWISCLRDTYCIDGSCMPAAATKWHFGECDESNCGPNKYLKCETQDSTLGLEMTREICIRTTLSPKK